MNSNNVLKSIGASLTLIIALSLAPMASASTPGQGDRDHGKWNRARMTRFAYALGYSRGYEDASQGSYHSYREIQRWREGTEGWENPMGTRTTFRDNFRRGFARGFMDARSNRPRRYSQDDVDRMRSESNQGRRRP
jgi:hypothetical protein